MRDKAPSLIGKQFDYLTVISRASSDRYGNARWNCKCSCGKLCVISAQSLRNGHARSCGHLQKEWASKSKFVHGYSDSKLYSAWTAMIYRCENNKNPSYVNYGGRGICVCPEWHDFLTFRKWAISHGYKEGLTIERIDVNRGYEPSNCIYADRVIQNRNTRRNIHIFYNGQKLTISEFSRIINVRRTSVLKWYHQGSLIEKAEQFHMKGNISADGYIEIYDLNT